MSSRVHRRIDCRLCESEHLELVISLTPTPPANAFVPREALGSEQDVFPLDVFFCRACGHVQLLDAVDPQELFGEYVYVSGTSPIFVEHFRRYAGDAVRVLNLPAGSLVVDVGSNDGTLLRWFQCEGMRVLGIDPAENIARAATEAGIETLAAFFTPEAAGEIREQHGPAALITANNVFAHADDLQGFTEGVRRLLAPDGVFMFEVSYLVDVYQKTLFDTIYHEHVAYHSVTPLRSFFARQGMELIDCRRVDTHGGSVRGTVQHAGGPRQVSRSVDDLEELERSLGLDRPETLQAFSEKIDGVRRELGALLRNLKSQGKRLAGYGAPAKATTLMYHFGFGPDVLDFIVDDSPLKQGLYTPGLHVPVLPSATLYERWPDYVLILAWNFAESVAAKHRAYCEQGGKFIVPLPQIEVWGSEDLRKTS